MKRSPIVILFLCVIALAACTAPPADVFETGSVPAEPVSSIYVVAAGKLAPIALATVLADIKAEFTLPVEKRFRADAFTATDRNDLPARLRELRGDRPLSTVMVVLTDQPLLAADSTISSIGVAVPDSRSLVVASSEFHGPNRVMGQREADDYSRLFFHLFAHTLGVGHIDNANCLMQDWRNDPRRLMNIPDKYCSATLRVFQPFLKVRGAPPAKDKP
ncbi:MAG TPA: hypothetical protein PKW95_23550 [bacterium]|nr:hypothetical protein [bacterium]